MNALHLRRLELNKILAAAAAHARLEAGRERVLALLPRTKLKDTQEILNMTAEAYYLFCERNAPAVLWFPSLNDLAERAEKGSVLTCAELIGIGQLLDSTAALIESIEKFSQGQAVRFSELSERLTPNKGLAKDIAEKIEGEKLADHASDRLYAIRRDIRALNERIRTRLSAYLTGEEKKFLQDGIITMRGDRYVLPVKAEYKRSVKGFIHDRSATGATVFIEPEEVLEMNNELRSLELDEREEVERILGEFSREVGHMRSALERNADALAEADSYYARALYADTVHAVRPVLNERGIIKINKGRHPLLDQKSAVPVSLELGGKYDFLVISGANTGGKTVTLKMCGLFCLMAACGMYVPAEDAQLSVFDGVYCDIGDSQSIEENLSTFSSHVLNLKEIVASAGLCSLALIDEPGGGTDPEEGQALAKSVIVSLMEKGVRGIVTTHYSSLKEFAYEEERIENASMEFDASTYRPLYRLHIGTPGSSNALAICSRLGLGEEIIERARGYLSDGARAFEHTVRAAEESRILTDEAKRQAEELKGEWKARLKALERDEAEFKKEKEKFLLSSKAEARRIVNERTARAEEILGEIEELFKKETLSESDVIRARTLKNKLAGAAQEQEEQEKVRLIPVDLNKLKTGDKVYVASFSSEGEVLSVKKEKKTAEVRIGAIRATCAVKDLYLLTGRGEKKKEEVKVVRNLAPNRAPKFECNLIGMTVQEALPELNNFLDSAVLANFKTVRIVHGMGTGTLRRAVQEYLKKDRRVEEYRLGVYGEGESGVTIVTLK
ncbi:MAG: endonuclease MutS2 [Clostridiales bacterium]|nr:endonuclease MutS2 [Clostridiales bacterium]